MLQQGDIDLEVVFVAPDDDSDDENHEYEDENGFRSHGLSFSIWFFEISHLAIEYNVWLYRTVASLLLPYTIAETCRITVE